MVIYASIRNNYRFHERAECFHQSPTCSRKYLCCFDLPAIFNDERCCTFSIAIIVSPLTALMKVQVVSLIHKAAIADILGTCNVIAMVMSLMEDISLYSLVQVSTD